MQYKILTTSQQIEIIDQMILNTEAAHYGLVLELSLADDPQPVPEGEVDQSPRAMTERQIEKFDVRLAKLHATKVDLETTRQDETEKELHKAGRNGS